MRWWWVIALAACAPPPLELSVTLDLGEATQFTVNDGEVFHTSVVVTEQWPSWQDAASHPIDVVATYPDGAFADFLVGFGCFSDDSPEVALTSVRCAYALVRHHAFAGTLGGPGVDGSCVCEGDGYEFSWDSTKAY